MTIQEVAEQTGKTTATIYRLAKKLGRIPTVEEVKNVKMGRPSKYK